MPKVIFASDAAPAIALASMHFTLTGADKATGEEKTIGLTADSEAQVRQWAQDQGLLVSSIAPDNQIPIAAVPRSADPHDITGNATILQFIGGILIALGILAIIAGVVAALLTQFAGWTLAVYAWCAGAASLASGAALRMLAAIGLTLRDYVRR